MHALKIETAGIQRYIFSSNKLKVNLGASYIIEHLLFKDLLKEAVEDVLGVEYVEYVDNWYSENDNSVLGNDTFQVGYIGGGNALLLGGEDKLKALDRSFKELVLLYFPGMEVYSGIVEWTSDFRADMARLSLKVNENRSSYPFVNRTPNHGFYNKCRISGGVASHFWKVEKAWVSEEVFSKIVYTDGNKDVNVQHEKDLIKDYSDAYTFPLDFENLSAKEDKAYIAVVHIDGNNLGQAFIDAIDIGKTRELSHKVGLVGRKALQKTIEGLIGMIENGDIENNGFLKKTNDAPSRVFLPIRPLITGGDDITFVCEGTLGIPLAKLFLEKFHETGRELGLLNGDVHACAGVAIVKQKYPFYRAYQLSEELIKEAKKASRGNPGSYLSVMVAGYGTGTSLEDLRNKYAKPDLFNPTYQVVGSNYKPTIHELTDLISLFNERDEMGQRKIPRNKLMDIRFALASDQIEEVWPVVKSRIGESNIDPEGNKALTFEAIELMDFYHPSFLPEKKYANETV